MTLTDPSRPRMGDRPMLLNHQSVIPEPSLWPLASDMVRLTVWLPVGDNLFGQFSMLTTLSQLAVELRQFRSDPERWFEGKFCWGYARLKRESGLSMEDFL